MSYFNNSDSDDESTHSFGSNSSSDSENDDNDFVVGGSKKDKIKIQNLAINLQNDDLEEVENEDEEDLEQLDDLQNIQEEGEEVNANEELNDTDDDDNDDNDIDDDDDGEIQEKINKKKIKKISSNFTIDNEDVDNDDDDDDDVTGEDYLKKFNQEINKNYILNFHQESVLHNYDEILNLTKVVRNADGTIIDPLHKTLPYLTKYEKTRVIGQRAKQIDSGATAFVKVPENVIEGYLIAEIELKEKKIPFIIRRPLPNGGSEYWHISDLENIIF